MKKPEELPKAKYSVYNSEELPARGYDSKMMVEINNSEEYKKKFWNHLKQNVLRNKLKNWRILRNHHK